jgi:PAS domain S-box-containing protein
MQTGELILNEDWARTAGYRLEELQPISVQTWRTLCHPDDLERARPILKRHLDGLRPYYEFESRMRHKDGHWIWVADRGAVASWTDDRRPLWIRGLRVEVTGRKRHEDSVAASKAKLEAALASMADALFITDAAGRFIEFNEAFATVHGFHGKAECKRTLEDYREILEFFLPDGRPAAFEQRPVPRALGGETATNVEFRVVRTDTGRSWIASYNFAPIRDPAGAVVGMVATARDITAQRRQESDRAVLESRLAEAERLESIGRLAGGVAHDFNNMLGVILAHAELGMDGLDPTHPLYESLAEIERTAERSANLTRQLLAFARKQTIDPRVLDLNRAVDGLYKMLTRLIDESVVLAWRPGEGVWPVKMDPTQIDQILANLCVNARDALRGDGRIGIQTGNTSLTQEDCAKNPDCQAGDYAWLAVTDNGGGMGPETLAHLFEPFYTTKAVGKGTGLGLATVYGIVHQNRGFIQVESTPGRGSSFKIFLPRHQGAEVPEPAEAQAAQLGPTGETVLVVEDEPAMLRMATQMVRSLGYDVLSAPSPAQALDLARRHSSPIHLLLTDVVMPGMNGRELADAVLAWHPGLRRVYMSGYTSDILAPEGILDDSVDFLHKPFTKPALAGKLRAALQR